MFSLLGLCALFLACSQGAGEPCQVDGDCDTGLVCSARGSARGECVTELAEDEEPGPDAAMPSDDEDAGG